jgi:hypothetical protein
MAAYLCVTAVVSARSCCRAHTSTKPRFELVSFFSEFSQTRHTRLRPGLAQENDSSSTAQHAVTSSSSLRCIRSKLSCCAATVTQRLTRARSAIEWTASSLHAHLINLVSPVYFSLRLCHQRFIGVGAVDGTQVSPLFSLVWIGWGLVAGSSRRDVLDCGTGRWLRMAK